VRDGHHRREAYLQLISEGEDIRAIDVDEFGGNDADAIALLLTSAQGKPLTPLQAGQQYAKLLKYGWKVNEIASKVGKSSSHVSQMLQLTGADEDVKGMVTRKEVSATTALASVIKHGSGAKKHLDDGLQKARLSGKSKATAKEIEGGTPKSLVIAIEVEIESGGTFKADIQCPKYAALINYLRGTEKS
jgi:ParB-like chromosome segregation protein Spo0J